jgi:uncharacterized phage protein (TIGR02218 family)
MQVQLFGFTLNEASLYVTNDNVDHTYSGITYTASAITCKEFSYDLKEVMGEASISMPFLQSGFLAGAASRSIEGAVHIDVYEFETTDDTATLVFRGFVNTFKVSKAMLDVQCVSFIEHARDNYARMILTRVCNHRLYSALCGANEASYTFTGTIVGFSVDRVTVEVSGIGAGSGYFTYGFCKWQGAYRHIVNDVWNGSTRYLDLMHFAPTAWEIGQGISIVAGCDKTTSTCSSKFGMFQNFMGFPYAPYESIRYTGLRTTTIKKSKK